MSSYKQHTQFLGGVKEAEQIIRELGYSESARIRAPPLRWSETCGTSPQANANAIAIAP
ncbi:MAG TPA: hypothetical protein VJV05_05780 [Pyrinomonadaceae bacterium]|nr:hypothetical protein [Pyrinomonadaceae bacterium]